MASLIERLMDTLNREQKEYEELLGISRRKTPIIVSGTPEELVAITDEEQIVVNRILRLDSEREEEMREIAHVLNTDVENLKLDMLVRALERRPEEQRLLNEAVDKLNRVAKQVQDVNVQNKGLLDTAMEMVDFEINLYKSMSQAPTSANYDKDAYNAGMAIGTSVGGFDAKQ